MNGFLLLALLACLTAGCGRPVPEVVVYAAQDRVHAEPILQAFTGSSGIRVRAVYDNEATKTVGLANRLAAEAGQPRADLWWSNEELRTRQLIRQGVLEGVPRAFGARQRVLVIRTNGLDTATPRPGFERLTNAAFRGRIALAYPLFGTTATHFLVLRQRRGPEAWESWCRALLANRPLIVDGNSVVVKLVAGGQVELGLTDSDDVAAARREGLPVVAVPLDAADGLTIPNTVARVKGAPHPDEARRLAEFLAGPEVRRQLSLDGAIDPEPRDAQTAPSGVGPGGDAMPRVDWDRLLADLETGVTWLQENFTRARR